MDLNVREWGAELVDNFMIFNLSYGGKNGKKLSSLIWLTTSWCIFLQKKHLGVFDWSSMIFFSMKNCQYYGDY